MTSGDFADKRMKMLELDLEPRGIDDAATLASMGLVPRHRFVPEDLQNYAYADGPLAIGQGQTISQPYIVALMTQSAELKPDSNVLEIGTGSGYAAAVLSRIVREVYTVERIPELAKSAEVRYRELGYGNIHVKIDDGTLGWPEHAPYDAIIVTAGAPSLPESLIEQLKPGGRMVIPVGDSLSQELIRVRKNEDGEVFREFLGHVRFVPLIGEQGWRE